jgi:Na+-driven multidrug efflux pump
MAVGAISSAFLLYAPTVIGLSGVWSGLTLFMGLRIVAGYMRYVQNCAKSFLFLSLHLGGNLLLNATR